MVEYYDLSVNKILYNSLQSNGLGSGGDGAAGSSLHLAAGLAEDAGGAATGGQHVHQTVLLHVGTKTNVYLPNNRL